MLHMHTLWSDGRALPEQAVAAYKDAGYDFISITDHNRLGVDPARYVAVGNGTEKGWPPLCVHPDCYRQYMERFGKTASVRKVPIYDDRIGATVRLVEGRKGERLEASYRLAADDLYVRARVESDAPTQFKRKRSLHPEHHTAWTQPYCCW